MSSPHRRECAVSFGTSLNVAGSLAAGLRSGHCYEVSERQGAEFGATDLRSCAKSVLHPPGFVTSQPAPFSAANAHTLWPLMRRHSVVACATNGRRHCP